MNGAFSVVFSSPGAPVPNRVVAHEFGHNFGIRHERRELGAGTEAYYHGVTTDKCQATIMSYGAGCGGGRSIAIPYYGSPWRYGPGGRLLGVSRLSKERGLRGPADAVLTLNRNRHRVASFQPSRNGE